MELVSRTDVVMGSICHLTTVHPRFDGRVFHKECSSIASNGYQTYLVVADGLGAQERSGVKIYDIGKSQFGRLGRVVFKTAKMFFTARKVKADIYHFHDPELIFTGLMLKLFGCKVVFDIHENLPLQIMHKYWIPKMLRSLISTSYRLFESLACRFFDALLVPQPTMQEEYLKINSNTELIANFVDTSLINFENTQTESQGEYCVLVHAGALSDTRGLFNMLNAYSFLPSNYNLILAGNISSGEDNLQAKQHHYWGRVDFRGVITSEEVNDIYNESSIGLILYNNVGQYYLSYAIKLFEFMARGIPVVMPDFGEWPQFNEKYKCGVCVDVQSPESVAKKIQELWNDKALLKTLGNNGQQAIKSQFNWGLEANKLFKVYEGILNGNKK